MKLSAVIQLIDSYLQQPAVFNGNAKDIVFTLDDEPVLPLCKAQAQFVLNDLDKGNYQMDVQTEYFFPEQFELNVAPEQSLSEQITIKQLLPNPIYPYPQGTTLLMGMVRSSAGLEPLSDVTVKVQYESFRGTQKSSQTMTYDKGRYDGRYAVALRGKLQPSFSLTVDFSKPGFESVTQQLMMANGETRFADADMN
jgi:hypothetical protein